MDEKTFWLLVGAGVALVIPIGVVVIGIGWTIHRLLCERRGAALPEPVVKDW